MAKRAALLSIFVGLLATGYSTVDLTAHNYADPAGPHFSGRYATPPRTVPRSVTVLSYNIQFSRNVPQAIGELRSRFGRELPDILLLQEMDETGTEQIARALGLNYVYYPVAIHPQSGTNFGNAVLARWPIADAQKVILPHQSLGSSMNRAAVRATIQMGNRDIVAYSVHTETIVALPALWQEQVAAVAEHVDDEAALVIVGGDFNTITAGNRQVVVDRFAARGLGYASDGSGHTLTRFRIPATTDHIFSRGFIVSDVGKMDDATASDHLPLWVTLKPVH
jgi:endonuclease/exonuclease/phosphatase family metal-dependent hydrolase